MIVRERLSARDRLRVRGRAIDRNRIRTGDGDRHRCV